MIEAIVGLFDTIINVVANFLPNVWTIATRGVDFLISLFTTIPNFLTDSFINNLPPFFQTGFYGLLGVMLFILVTKIVALIKF